jgi:hypothetical protein
MGWKLGGGGEDTEIRVRGSENGKKVRGSGNVRGKDGVKLLLGESKENSKGYRKSKRKIFELDPDSKMSTEKKGRISCHEVWILSTEN